MPEEVSGSAGPRRVEKSAARGSRVAVFSVGALAVALFLLVNPTVVTSVVIPDAPTSHMIWIVTLLVVGIASADLLTLAIRDHYLRGDDASNPLLGAKFLETALSQTGLATLWAILVAVAASPAPPSDALSYLGNATMLGLILGLVLQVLRWTMSATRAVADVIKLRNPAALLQLTIAVTFTVSAFVIMPLLAALSAG